MGIDKPDVSFVVHYNMPKSIEAYYQEAGRAGRDGRDAHCLLLYNKKDNIINKSLIIRSIQENRRLSENEKEIQQEHELELLKQMTFYCTTYDCLRNFILSYFGESVSDDCNHCGNCLQLPELVDISNEVRAIILTAEEMQQKSNSHGALSLSCAVRGANHQKTRDYHLDKLSNFGILSELTLQYTQQIIEYALGKNWLKRIDIGNGPKSKIIATSEGKMLLSSSDNIFARIPKCKRFIREKRFDDEYYKKWEEDLVEKIKEKIKSQWPSDQDPSGISSDTGAVPRGDSAVRPGTGSASPYPSTKSSGTGSTPRATSTNRPNTRTGSHYPSATSPGAGASPRATSTNRPDTRTGSHYPSAISPGTGASPRATSTNRPDTGTGSQYSSGINLVTGSAPRVTPTNRPDTGTGSQCPAATSSGIGAKPRVDSTNRPDAGSQLQGSNPVQPVITPQIEKTTSSSNKTTQGKKLSSCSIILIIIGLLIIFALFSGKKGNSRTISSTPVSNTNHASYITQPSKTPKPAATKKITVPIVQTAAPVIATRAVTPTQNFTPTAEKPQYIVYNPKDINGAPFYTKPNNASDLLIRSLRNQTPIEIIGEKEYRNNYEWYHIRDNNGFEGWIQAQFVTVNNQ